MRADVDRARDLAHIAILTPKREHAIQELGRAILRMADELEDLRAELTELREPVEA